MAIIGAGYPKPGKRLLPVFGVTAASVPLPTGFALNGSTNPALKAMLASGTGRIIFKGDSTTAGSSEDTKANASPPYYLGQELTGIGSTARLTALYGNNGLNGTSLMSYDPRWTEETNLTYAGGQAFAGGNYLNVGAGADARFTPHLMYAGMATKVFRVVCYAVGGTLGIALNDAQIPSGYISFAGQSGTSVSGLVATISSAGTGFTEIIITVPTAGQHNITVFAGGGAPGLIRSIEACPATPGIRILDHASAGAKSQDQATSGGYYNNDALGYDSPSLTIINCTLNTGTNYTPAVHKTYLQAMIDKGKLTGDVLLVSPHEAKPAFFSLATQATLRQADSEVAATNGIAYLSLADYFGSYTAMDAAGYFVDTVHLTQAAYAIVGQVYRRCIQAMAA